MRDLLHRLTHQHIEMTKPNVAEFVLCRRRLRSRIDVAVTLDLPQPGSGPWHLDDTSADALGPVFEQPTAVGMLGALTKLGAWRCHEAH